MLADGTVEPLEQSVRSRLQSSIDGMAGDALRCLAFALKEDLGELSGYNGESHPGHRLLLDNKFYPDIESNMTWLGVAGLRDPPRPEVAGAIQECYRAGIRVRTLCRLPFPRLLSPQPSHSLDLSHLMLHTSMSSIRRRLSKLSVRAAELEV